MWKYLLFIIPALCGYLAVRTGKYAFKVLITSLCMALVILLGGAGAVKEGLFILFGLAFSLAGDFFLSRKRENDSYFLYGVSAFLGAHVCYCVYAFGRAKGNGAAFIIFGLVLALVLLYYFFRLYQNIPAQLKLATLLYVVISCVSLLSAMLIEHSWTKVVYVLGIISIVVSDIAIGELEFMKNQKAGGLILPLYYLCHILISASVIAAAV